MRNETNSQGKKLKLHVGGFFWIQKCRINTKRKNLVSSTLHPQMYPETNPPVWFRVLT